MTRNLYYWTLGLIMTPLGMAALTLMAQQERPEKRCHPPHTPYDEGRLVAYTSSRGQDHVAKPTKAGP